MLRHLKRSHWNALFSADVLVLVLLHMEKLNILCAFLKFLMERKKFWLIPIVLVLVLLGILLVATEGSAVAPFIYTLF